MMTKQALFPLADTPDVDLEHEDRYREVSK